MDVFTQSGVPYTDQQIELLRLGIEAGLVQPSIIMRDSVAQAESHVVEKADESLLLKNISEESRSLLDEKTWARTEAGIRDAINRVSGSIEEISAASREQADEGTYVTTLGIAQ